MFSSRKTAAPSTGYNLTKSLRFRSSASAYLNRTPSASNRKTWTFSFWCKRGKLGTYQTPLWATTTGGTYDGTFVWLFDGDNFGIVQYVGGTYNCFLTTSALYRDPSAWYHFICAVDTTQATASNRVKLYVNGSLITALSNTTYPSQNYDFDINANVAHNIGRDAPGIGARNYFDGEFDEVNFIDGQQLTASSFGSFNSTTGVWQPTKYTGTYGTNGFYLPFTNTSSTTTLGYDFSGNSNNWATNNLSLTTGSTYDSMTDVPTLTSATTANYCVWNPLDKGSTSSFTFSDGNLKSANSDASNNYMGRATVAVSSGKWYWEVLLSSGTSAWAGGIATTTTGLSYGSLSSGSAYAYSNNGNSYNGQTGTSYGSTYAAGDTVMVAYDADNGKIWFGKNGTWQASGNPATATNPAYTGISGTYAPAYLTNSSTVVCNFGQQGFAYTPPTGFVALNTYNLPTSTIVKGNTVMDASLYTGNGSTQSITNTAGFKPDLVWVKSRSAATDHKLTDSVRGVQKALISDTTGAETTDTNGLTAFNSNGWSLGTDTNYNNNTATYVGWQWQAGQGSTSSNTSGSITSTVSVNATAGFSVVTWTDSASTYTVGHGLGVAPQFIILKDRSNTYNWDVGCNAIGWANRLKLNDTTATSAGYWNSTAPTSSVFTYIGNGTGNMVAYCWTPIAGFSSFGSYTGNGSTDGAFVYTGFRPKYIMMKSTSVESWEIFDTSRSSYNQAVALLEADSSGAENNSSTSAIDILSNGFKQRNTRAATNGSGTTYIYMAFAENPFKNALAR